MNALAFSVKKPCRGMLLFLLLGLVLPAAQPAAGTDCPQAATGEISSSTVNRNHKPAAVTDPDQAAIDGQAESGPTLRTLKERYRQDRTGVRARLGLCRHGMDGRPKGPHRHRHGDEKWQAP